MLNYAGLSAKIENYALTFKTPEYLDEKDSKAQNSRLFDRFFLNVVSLARFS